MLSDDGTTADTTDSQTDGIIVIFWPSGTQPPTSRLLKKKKWRSRGRVTLVVTPSGSSKLELELDI